METPKDPHSGLLRRCDRDGEITPINLIYWSKWVEDNTFHRGWIATSTIESLRDAGHQVELGPNLHDFLAEREE